MRNKDHEKYKNEELRMKNLSLHIAFAALLALLSLASCSRTDEVAVAEGEEGKVYVTLTLSINEEKTGSRAWVPKPNEDIDEPGNGWENEINRLQILIYDENDKYVGTVEDLFNSNGRYLGTLSGTNWQSGTYKFVVLANFTTDKTDLSELEDISYEYNAANIPMWGVIKKDFNFPAGENTDIGNIDLLRAMAKVEVNFAESFPADYQIGGITISPYNTKGYCVPAGYASVETTGALDREETNPASFHPLASSNTELLNFKGENNNYYIYLPEYENTETDAAKIKVTVNGETYDLEFKNYENGAPKDETPYNIVRNHIYRYTITGVNDGKLVVNYLALPWNKIATSIEFMEKEQIKGTLKAESSDAEATYGILHKPTYTDKKYNDGGDYSVLKPGSAGARYRFDLQAPVGTVWTAHLSNKEDFYFTDSEYKDKDNKKFVSTGIVRGSSDKKLPYYIQINATHPWQAITNEEGDDLKEGEIDFDTRSEWGSKVEREHRVVETYFYITVSADGKHETELEINPIEKSKTEFKDNRRFPGTATRIWIRQVPAQKGRGSMNTKGKTWPAQELAKNIDPTEDEFQWWRVNPYWK